VSATGNIKTGQSLPVIALSLLAGVCFLQLQPDLLGPLWTSSEILMFLPLLLWLFYFLPGRRGLLAFFTGYLWALLFAQVYLQHQLPQALQKQDILLQGVVIGLADENNRSTRFDFQVTDYISVNGNSHPQLKSAMPSRLRLSWYYRRGKIHSGDHWRLLVRLKQPHGMHNPGGFDYEKWLYQQGIQATGYIRKSKQNHIISQKSWGIDRLREKLHSIISRLPGEHYQGLLEALTIGHKSAISSDQWQVLRNTGTSHLMAISGLHIGLVAGLVFFLVRRWVPVWLCKRSSAPQVAAVFSLLAAGFYALLAGFTVPTQRAFIMLLVLMSAILIRRPALSINTLSLALIAVIMINPVSVLSVGFWLSFLAVLIISLVSGARVSAQKPRIYGAWLEGIRIQWLIALGMLPLSLLLFQQGSLISPIANMLVIPLVGMLVVPLALLASLTSLVSIAASNWLFSQAGSLLAFIWTLLEWFAQSPLASWQTSSIPLLQSGFALLGVLLLLMPRGFPLRYSGLILLLPMLLYQYPRPQQGEFWVDVLDVGQGLSVLVQTRDKTLLYDTGAKFSERFDIGQRVVVPYLNYKGIEQLDTLLISHGDNDHAGGVDAVLQLMDVKLLLGEAEFIQQQNRSEQATQACKAGDHWQWNGVDFEILHPAQAYKKSNNRSCVLKIWNAQHSLLLPGDMERKAERHMLKQSADALAVDVLIVPHHGSNTSSSQAWLEKLKPELAIVSAGYKNRFGHPTAKVLARYQQLGSRLLNTADGGMIQMKFGQSSATGALHTRQQRKVVVHYWNHRF